MGRSLLTFFCPVCWTETPTGGGTCPRCGADMEAVQRGRDFVDKLIAALDHPEPGTRARAAMILGLRRERRGAAALMRVVRKGKDAFLVEAAIEALGRIGDPGSRDAIEAAALDGTLRVRGAARRALVTLDTSPKDSSGDPHGERRNRRPGCAVPGKSR